MLDVCVCPPVCVCFFGREEVSLVERFVTNEEESQVHSLCIYTTYDIYMECPSDRGGRRLLRHIRVIDKGHVGLI